MGTCMGGGGQDVVTFTNRIWESLVGQVPLIRESRHSVPKGMICSSPLAQIWRNMVKELSNYYVSFPVVSRNMQNLSRKSTFSDSYFSAEKAHRGPVVITLGLDFFFSFPTYAQTT